MIADLVRLARSQGGLGNDALLAAVLPLFRQTAEIHERDLVAPLRGLDRLTVDDRSRLGFPPELATRPLLQPGAVRERERRTGSAIEVVSHRHADTDFGSGAPDSQVRVVPADPDAITAPVLVAGWQSWEHVIGHHDPLTDIFSLGQLLIGLSCGLDLALDEDVSRLIVARGNLFVLRPDLHPVIASVATRMAEPDRHRRAQDLRSLIGQLENYRDQPLDFDVTAVTRGSADRRTAVLTALRDRLFDLSRRNRLVNFRHTAQSLNLTEVSVPLMLDVRNIRAEHLFTWNKPLAKRLLSGSTHSLGRWIRYDEAPYAAGALDKLISTARRDRAEYGQDQLRLVPAFLRWHDLKNDPGFRLTSPLLLVKIELAKKRGVRDSYTLKVTDPVAEVNPTLRQHLRQLYAIDLPDSVDLSAPDALERFHARLAAEIKASEPGLLLRLRDKPRIDLVRHRAMVRLRSYRRRQHGNRAGEFGTRQYGYSYRRADYQPLGIQIFQTQLAAQDLPLGVLLGEEPAPRSPGVVETDLYTLDSGDDGSPYAWDIDLCAVALANFNYRTLGLVRDYDELLTTGKTGASFEQLFSDEPRPLAASADELPMADRYLVVPADGSQVTALSRARQGESFVIQGPPGTGKSQTITNMIADFAARGKRVLFVCQKRAALDVVHARLAARRLSELCTLIHDSQADKKAFVHGLRDTYERWLTATDDLPAVTARRDQIVTRIEDLLTTVTHYESTLATPTPTPTEPTPTRPAPSAANTPTGPPTATYSPTATPTSDPPATYGSTRPPSSNPVAHSAMDAPTGTPGQDPPAPSATRAPTESPWQDPPAPSVTRAPSGTPAPGRGSSGPNPADAVQVTPPVGSFRSGASGPTLREVVNRLAELRDQKWGLDLPPELRRLLPTPAEWWSSRSAVAALSRTLAEASPATEGVLAKSPLAALAPEVWSAPNADAEVPVRAARVRAAWATVAAVETLPTPTTGPHPNPSTGPHPNPSTGSLTTPETGDPPPPETGPLANPSSGARPTPNTGHLADREAGLSANSGFSNESAGVGRRGGASGQQAFTRRRQGSSVDSAVVDVDAVPVGRLRVLGSMGETVLPLAERGRGAAIDPGSAARAELRQAIRQLGVQMDAARAAWDAAAGWRDPLPPADARAALAVAERKEGSLFGFLSGEWRRVKALVAERYDASTRTVKPKVTELLRALVAAHDASTAAQESVERAERDWGTADLTGLADRLAAFAQDPDPELAGWRTALATDSTPATAAALTRLAAALRSADDAARGFLVDELADRSLGEVRATADYLTDPHLGPAIRSLAPAFSRFAATPQPLQLAVRSLAGSPDEIEYAVCAAHWQRAQAAAPVLAHLTSLRLDDVVDQLGAAYEELTEVNARLVVAGIRSRFLTELAHSQLTVSGLGGTEVTGEDRARMKAFGAGRRVLEHEFGKTMRYKSIRDLSSGDPGLVVSLLRPVWLMSPSSVSDTLPLDATFDVVIYDEASQIPIEEAIPALHRAPQVVVVGDQMQLPPTQYFRVMPAGPDEDEEEADQIGVVLDSDSFLAISALRLPSTMLTWHYRSRSEALISFSNAAFYQGRLATIPDRLPPRVAPPWTVQADATHLVGDVVDGVLAGSITTVRVHDGVYQHRRNPAEASWIAAMVRELLSRETGASIGVVAFSEAQQTEIEHALEDLAQDDPEFATRYEAELVRTEDDQDVSLFVKNLENVQGDERDIVIMSVCYAAGPDGRMLMNFGPINTAGGEKRLNVIFSRAKQHMVIVSSIAPDAITNTYNDGANTLRRFLEYAEAVSRGDTTVARAVLAPYAIARHRQAAGQDKIAAVGQLVSALEAHDGVEVSTDVGESVFRCDLALSRTGDAGHRLAVLVDTPERVASDSLLERLSTHQRALATGGWQVRHVLVSDWIHNPDGVIRTLTTALRTD